MYKAKNYILLFSPLFLIGQTSLDNQYREDQFYFSATYNLLNNKPNDIAQRGFSTGFHLGFIRDFPINKKRTWALGLGLGLSSNSYNNNMLISETINGFQYNTIDETTDSFTKNKFTTYLVEVPFEIRWRSSDAESFKFWRIYSGFKLGYLLHGTSKFRGSLGDIDTSNPNFERLQYGLTLSVGYSTFNLHLYYGLNPIFDNMATLNNEPLDLSTIKIGLITYIL
ncbi:porin family protein [Ichthyenterobacterium sp. W332]|uniref:Porin family protein n=1 Tax=Microcosmobacter mediterraneus TaxID=3075607 RepID=A0ABU2YHY3_9FLAO|nr:porin family protein [Ichthyenterobacterium sp. W332]MDT0557779.1 porin family protein [Ichthyenterobacterium sp. W332]